eukprot:Nk52_evm19s152 gene=Nk52_evmTU19s152
MGKQRKRGGGTNRNTQSLTAGDANENSYEERSEGGREASHTGDDSMSMDSIDILDHGNTNPTSSNTQGGLKSREISIKNRPTAAGDYPDPDPEQDRLTEKQTKALLTAQDGYEGGPRRRSSVDQAAVEARHHEYLNGEQSADLHVIEMHPAIPNDTQQKEGGGGGGGGGGSPSSLDAGRLQSYVIVVIILSWVLIVTTGVGGLFCFVYSWIVDSSALLTFSLETIIDMVASFLVLWRFRKVRASDYRMMDSQSADLRAGAAIALVLTASNIFSLIVAIVNLAERDAPDDPETIKEIMIGAFIFLLAMGIIQLYLAQDRILGSIPLRLDGISSLAGAGVALSIVISSSVYEDHPDVWWIDAAAGLIISCVMICLGCYNLYCIKGWTQRPFWTDN